MLTPRHPRARRQSREEKGGGRDRNAVGSCCCARLCECLSGFWMEGKLWENKRKTPKKGRKKYSHNFRWQTVRIRIRIGSPPLHRTPPPISSLETSCLKLVFCFSVSPSSSHNQTNARHSTSSGIRTRRSPPRTHTRDTTNLRHRPVVCATGPYSDCGERLKGNLCLSARDTKHSKKRWRRCSRRCWTP